MYSAKSGFDWITSSINLFLMFALSASSSYCASAFEYTFSIISPKVFPSLLTSLSSVVIVAIIVPRAFLGKSLSGFNVTTLEFEGK